MDRSGTEARFDRLDLREVLWRVSSIEACRKCGRIPIASPVVEVNGDGRARFGGLASCQSIWACPVCAAPLRVGRAREISDGLAAVFAAGGGALFVTLTVPHHFGDALVALLTAIKRAWSSLTCGRFSVWLRDEFGIVGLIRSLEVTVGENGWHPHLHVLFVFEAIPGDIEMGAFDGAIFDRYCAAAVRAGLGAPSREHGIVTRRVIDSAGVAEYVAKLERDLVSAALELSMSNMKRGRDQHLAPFELLGQAAFDVRSKMLWQAYEQALRGSRAVFWSPGLKGRLGVVEVDDASLIEGQGVGYVPLLMLDRETFADLSYRVRGFQSGLLRAVELGGSELGSAFVAGLLAGTMEVAA